MCFKPLFSTDIWSDFSNIMKTIIKIKTDSYTLWWVVKGIKFEGHFEKKNCIFFIDINMKSLSHTHGGF
jgi:hypothetical protein